MDPSRGGTRLSAFHMTEPLTSTELKAAGREAEQADAGREAAHPFIGVHTPHRPSHSGLPRVQLMIINGKGSPI